MMIESESSQLPGQQPDELPESSGQEPGQQPEELSLDELLSEELLSEELLSDDEEELSLEDEPEEALLLPPEELEERVLRKSARGSALRSSRKARGAAFGRAAEWTSGAERMVAAEMTVQGAKVERVRAEDMVACWFLLC